VTSEDILIPKILVTQHTSKRLKDGKCAYGDIYDSVNGEIFGNMEHPVQFIPFHLEKNWVEYTINAKGKRDYNSTYDIQDNPLLPGYNDDLPNNEGKGPGSISRDRVMLFYVLLPSKLAEGVSLPYVLDFRRSSLRAGKKLATVCYINNRAEGLVPPAKTLDLNIESVSNDDGDFCVQDVSVARMSTKEEIAEALSWFKMVKKGAAVADNTDKSQENPDREVKNHAENIGKY
jgi:hypothetical protein